MVTNNKIARIVFWYNFIDIIVDRLSSIQTRLKKLRCLGLVYNSGLLLSADFPIWDRN